MRLYHSKYFIFIFQASCIAFSLAFSSTYACTQTPGDNSCNAELKPASTKQSFKASEDIGNPISLISGNKFQKEVDYEASGGVASLVLRRYYNSTDTVHDNGLGLGWRHSFNLILRYGDKTMEVSQSDGRRIVFKADPVAGVYRGVSPSDGIISFIGKNKQPLWALNDGRTIAFKGNYPIKITYPGKQSFRLQYQKNAASKLARVIDQQGRVLEFHYSSGNTALANFSQAPSANVALAGHLTSVTLLKGHP